MKRIIIYLSVLCVISLYPSCPPPAPGTRCWDIAATALDTIITTESALNILIENITVDIIGIYTVASAIDTGLNNAQSGLYNIDSNLDILVTEIIQTQSKLTTLESQLISINTIFEQLNADIAGTYTALDALETTIVSDLDILATELETVQAVITDITASSIDHNETIASQLDILQMDVNELNSVLDSINWPNLNTSIDTLNSLIEILSNNVNDLQNSIQTGFAGTFTALDAQLNEIGIIESIAENIHVSNMTDLSGVYTSLHQLDVTLNDIESLVDIITLINAKNTVMATESLMEQSVSQVDIIESKIAPLPSLADQIISVLEAVDLFLLDQAISRLDIPLTQLDSIESLSDTISSKLGEVIIDNYDNLSALALIATISNTIASSLDNFNLPISQLEQTNTTLDTMFATELTIESLVDDIFDGLVTINSALDPLISKAEILNSILETTETMDFTISSVLDITIDNLATINSTLDQITQTSESSMALLITIESSLDISNSIFDDLAITSIESKLEITSNLENSIISKLDIAVPFIATLNNQAQELINDFESTWTILYVIDGSLNASQTTLNIIESTLEDLNPHDISTVFTIIDTILRNEATVNSQVDRYNSMVDAFTLDLNTDFNGVFTALTAINTSNAFPSSMLSIISSKLSNIQTALGFPIYQNDIPLTINIPGRYYLAENINYSGASNAITINVSDVAIDLNERTLRYTGASSVAGIVINAVNNITIFAGDISSFTTNNITIDSAATNIYIHDIDTSNSGTAVNGRNLSLHRCTLAYGNTSALTIGNGTNIDALDCFFTNHRGIEITGNVAQMVVQDSVYSTGSPTTSLNDCIAINGTAANIVLQNSSAANYNTGINTSATDTIGLIAINNNFLGLANAAFIIGGSEGVIMSNSAINCSTGITNNGLAPNYFLGLNTLSQNSSGNIVITSGADTILGNFAFNTNAVGDPDNTNYNLAGSTNNITGKFMTASQTGSLGDFPDKWHNINMLP